MIQKIFSTKTLWNKVFQDCSGIFLNRNQILKLTKNFEVHGIYEDRRAMRSSQSSGDNPNIQLDNQSAKVRLGLCNRVAKNLKSLYLLFGIFWEKISNFIPTGSRLGIS